MNARTKLTALERAHTLLVIVLGTLAASLAMRFGPLPKVSSNQYLAVVAGLAFGYVVAGCTSTLIGRLSQGVRTRLTSTTLVEPGPEEETTPLPDWMNGFPEAPAPVLVRPLPDWVRERMAAAAEAEPIGLTSGACDGDVRPARAEDDSVPSA